MWKKGGLAGRGEGGIMDSTEHFEAVVSQHYEVLFRFAMSLTRSQADAEDLTQQTFYVWATKGHQLRDASKVKTWLFTTLHRAFVNARKKQTRFPHHDLDAVADELPSAESQPAGAATDASHALAALAQVDAVYQAAVALYYLDDLSYDEIASVLEIPAGTVKSRLSRGITQLRTILHDTGSNSNAAANWDSSPTGPQGTRSNLTHPTCVAAHG